MPTNYYGAISEIFASFKTAWDAGTTAVVGSIPHIEWPGVDTGFLPDGSAFWARISTKGVLTEQGTFCENVIAQGSQRFTTYGLVYVQLYAPKRNDSFALLNKLAVFTQNIFRTGTANVILRNSRIVEQISENGCLRCNVVAEFEFDQIA